MLGLGCPTTLSARSACRVFPSEQPVVLVLAPVGQSLEDWANTSGRVLDEALALGCSRDKPRGFLAWMLGLGCPTTLSARSACRVFPSEQPVVLVLAPVGQSLEDWANTSGRVLDDTLASLLVTWYRVHARCGCARGLLDVVSDPFPGGDVSV